MNLKRQLKEFIENGIYHSNISSNINIMICFEKWAHCSHFENLVKKELAIGLDRLLSK